MSKLKKSDISRIKKERFGSLQVACYIGRTSEGERLYECTCICGQTVVRSVRQLQIKKLHRCSECKKERTEGILERKQQERSKGTLNAHRLAARPQGPEEARP